VLSCTENRWPPEPAVRAPDARLYHESIGLGCLESAEFPVQEGVKDLPELL